MNWMPLEMLIAWYDNLTKRPLYSICKFIFVKEVTCTLELCLKCRLWDLHQKPWTKRYFHECSWSTWWLKLVEMFCASKKCALLFRSKSYAVDLNSNIFHVVNLNWSDMWQFHTCVTRACISAVSFYSGKQHLLASAEVIYNNCLRHISVFLKFPMRLLAVLSVANYCC